MSIVEFDDFGDFEAYRVMVHDFKLCSVELRQRYKCS